MKTKRIGVFGGSFNPVHRGHLAAAVYACSELDLDKLYFVPSRQTPLKEKQLLLPAALRLTLLKRAIRGHEKFAVSDMELKRKGISYTVDTLRAFKKKFGVGTQLYFLAGADNHKNFSRWKSSSEVLKLCRFVIMTRPGSGWKSLDRRFLWLPMPPVNVSSTLVRKRLALGKKIADLIPKNIEEKLIAHQGRKSSKAKKRSR